MQWDIGCIFIYVNKRHQLLTDVQNQKIHLKLDSNQTTINKQTKYNLHAMWYIDNIVCGYSLKKFTFDLFNVW